ncbi:MAG: M20/M25/M40 family metallo-hydrolase [Planctomycetes bacterium]|nr:M20/M25/M40 family metallo-hydrolase [Planctomycetota bacterium]NOG54363.1 M20/M25/M40 family metallo-hydrolase [Planctomycetota bacterium]
MTTTQDVLAQLDQVFDSSVSRLAQWLSIPSVGTDPACNDDTRRAGQWLVDQLSAIGLEAQLAETPGHPVVMAHHPGPVGYAGPHILFYGHYDVQPADPLDLWKSPPFEPVIEDGPTGKRIVARGAADDKGQVMTFVEALRAWKDVTGEIPCRITCLVEGEEESGSVNLDNFLTDQREALVGTGAANGPCDFVVVSDTGMWDSNTPALTTMLRGLIYLEFILHGPSHDLHSGMAGGCVPNPINELTRIFGRLHDADRCIQIPGFYDDVQPLSDALRAEWEALGFDEQGFLTECGLTEDVGEYGYSLLERQWGRPTCDINGIVGGYTGKGAKTVIPATASVKVSCRLVPNQDPDKITQSFIEWVKAQVPPACKLEVLDHGSGRPFVMAPDSPYVEVARAGLEEDLGKRPVLMGCGGSIPVVESFKRILGLDALLVGFGLSDDRVHSPNEKFDLKCFNLGQRTHAALLSRFAGMQV